jgi:hypothetical protein
LSRVVIDPSQNLTVVHAEPTGRVSTKLDRAGWSTGRRDNETRIGSVLHEMDGFVVKTVKS